jgi:transposase
MGEDYQIPILMSVLRGDGGIMRRSAELIWRERGSGSGKRAKDRDLYLDIRLMRRVNPVTNDIGSLIQDNIPKDQERPAGLVPVGVDMGLVNTAVAVAPGKGRRGVLFISGCKDRRVRRRLASRRAMLNRMKDDRKTTQRNSNRGDGRHRSARKAGKRFKALYKAEGRFVKDMCHKASRAVVDHALSKVVADRASGEVPVMVLEHLSFRDINRAVDTQAHEDAPLRAEQADELRSWAFGLLRDLIIEKCAWEGVPVVIMPANRSGLTCPRCGARAYRRRDVHRVVCPECTYRANDDYVAALNMAYRFLDQAGLPRPMVHAGPTGAMDAMNDDHIDQGASGLREKGDVGTS